MAPHYLLLQICGVFYFGGDSILPEEVLMDVTLEGKQSTKAKKLIDYLYEDSNYLYDVAENFQDEQKYTVSLLRDVLNKIDYSTLATLGFRESYLKSLVILFKDDISDKEYIERLIKSNDLVAIIIAAKIFELNNKLEYVKILESRLKND